MELFSDNTSLYFFSALLQANAAILSLLAIFVIFRIQSLASSIDTRKFVLGSDLGVHIPSHEINTFERMSIQEKKSEVDRLKGKGSALVAHFEAWVTYEEKIDGLRHSVIVPGALLAGSIFIFAVALGLASFIHSLSVYFEAALLAGSVSLEAFCLARVLASSFTMIGITAKAGNLSSIEKKILTFIRVKG